MCALNLWQAETTEEHVAGLKGVETLPSGIDGMIFDFFDSERRHMTMRSCLTPLAFFFVNEHYQVRQIEPRVDPDHDSPPIVSSEMDVRYVIELDTDIALNTRASLNDTISIEG